jgi:hypothetical protein
MTKPRSMAVEEVANSIGAAAARATKALREVSEAIAELREAAAMLKGLAAAPPTIVAGTQSPKMTGIRGSPTQCPNWHGSSVSIDARSSAGSEMARSSPQTFSGAAW